jgi:hypothetical protein
MGKEDRINFCCPDCGADLSDDAMAAARDFSEGLRESVGAFCEGCGRDVWFRLEWTMPEVWRAEPGKAVQMV